MDWIHLAQDMAQWPGLVNMVMKFLYQLNDNQILKNNSA
jgi:hypothetical protein